MSKPANEKPSAQEFGDLRAFLANAGVTQAQIDGAIRNELAIVLNKEPADVTQAELGQAHSHLYRSDITNAMKKLCRSFPKAS